MAAIEDSGGEELFFVQLGQVKKAKRQNRDMFG